MADSKYFVWLPTRALPMVRHETRSGAQAEARRLCALPENYGHEAYVLRAVESVLYTASPYRITTYSKKG